MSAVLGVQTDLGSYVEGQAAYFWLAGQCVAVVQETDQLVIERVSGGICFPGIWKRCTQLHVPYNEVVSVRHLPIKRYCLGLPLRLRKQHHLELQVLQRKPQQPWQWSLRKLNLSAEEAGVVKCLVQLVTQRLLEFKHRPKRLLVFINPFGGKRRARRIWDKVAFPVLAAAGVQCELVETTCKGHAEGVVAGLSLEQLQALDGLVAVGGDGMYSELLTAVLQHIHLHAALQLRLAHIPAGSTDAVACTLHGTRDPLTATLHIVLGDSTPLDVAGLVTLPPVTQPSAVAAAPAGAATATAASASASTAASVFGKSAGESTELLPGSAEGYGSTGIAAAGQQQQQQQNSNSRHHRRRMQHQRRLSHSQKQQRLQQQQQVAQEQQQPWQPDVRHFVCVASYGFLGDVMRTSERLRWMGPIRYDVAGALRFLLLRGYKATVWYKPAECGHLDMEQGEKHSSSVTKEHQQHQQLVHTKTSSKHCSNSSRSSSSDADRHHQHAGRASVDGLSQARSTLQPQCDTGVPGVVQTNAGSISSHSSAVAGTMPTCVKSSASSVSSSSSNVFGKCYSKCVLCERMALQHHHTRRLFVASSRWSLTSTMESTICCGPVAIDLEANASQSANVPHVHWHAAKGAAGSTMADSCKHMHSLTAVLHPTTAAAVAGPFPFRPGWRKVEGNFASIMCVVTSCRSDKSKAGLLPDAHLADGRLALVLVHKRSRLQYLRFLIQLASQGVVPGKLPFVDVKYVTDVQIECHGHQSCWNIDGELLHHSRLRVGIYAGLVDVYARGIEVQ